MEGREEAPGVAGWGTGRAEGPSAPFSPRRRAGLKLISFFPKRGWHSYERPGRAGAACQQNSCLLPAAVPQRLQVGPAFPRPGLRNPSDCSCGSQLDQAVSPGPPSGNPWPGRPRAWREETGRHRPYRQHQTWGGRKACHLSLPERGRRRALGDGAGPGAPRGRRRAAKEVTTGSGVLRPRAPCSPARRM